MKKKFEKKLALNKKTISNLNKSDMTEVLGGSAIIKSCLCSESCSLIMYCCGPTTDPLFNNDNQEPDGN